MIAVKLSCSQSRVKSFLTREVAALSVVIPWCGLLTFLTLVLETSENATA